jgi:tRNA threonylcarbamoyladenosine biosynthesis protein TsaB
VAAALHESWNMHILSLDTTTDVSSIAVTNSGVLLAEYNFSHHMDLSRRLMPGIIHILKDCSLELEDLDAIGVSIGPGSFTGIRIGVVTAKTLAQTLGIPAAGVVSLDILAHAFGYLPGAVICPIIKVRKGEVYYAFYKAKKGTVERITEYGALPVSDLAQEAEKINGKTIIFCGDALETAGPELEDALCGRAVFAPAWLSYPQASVLSKIAREELLSGRAGDIRSVAPYYIRKSAPEARLECK